MDPTPEPQPQPQPAAVPQARPKAEPDSLGPQLADSYTALPQPPRKRGRAMLWAGLAALLALGLLAARTVSHRAHGGGPPAQIEASHMGQGQ